MGKVFKFGDNVDTDGIISARYLVTTNPAELGAHCMETVDPEFVRRVKQGDIMVAGRNFGCGSSREHAPLAIKAAGVTCVVAASFARIFLRNAVNIGLTALECPEAAGALKGGEEVEIDTQAGRISVKGGVAFQARPLPGFIREIVAAGGLMEYVSRRAKK